MTIEEKYEKLKNDIRALGSLAVAFSSGVDSTFLLRVAKDVLGDNVIAVTAVSGSFPVREMEEATDYCAENGIKQIKCRISEMDIPGFRDNPPNRCYLCKKEIFTQLIKVAKEQGMQALAEGSNVDDLSDYRPGLQAIKELGVLSPLREAGLTKVEIRELSKRLGLKTWTKPSFACLATRFVYGETITSEKLKMVDQAEQRLMDLGFTQFRVRMHGDMARIEIPQAEFDQLMKNEVRVPFYEYMKQVGFRYVSLDLGGYRTGSMNETLNLG